MNSKSRTVYVCSACGDATPKWQGQCPACQAWNTLSAHATPKASARASARPLVSGAAAELLGSVAATEAPRLPTGSAEFDRVLGGGLVAGSVTLIGGDPGIGKSTLLLQAAAGLARQTAVLYATGEESLQQVGLRARRLGLGEAPLGLLAETQVETVLEAAAVRDRKSTRLNSSHIPLSRMPSSA